MRKLLPIIIFLIVSASVRLQAQSKAPSPEIFNQLLKKYVAENGKVDYKGFIKDSTELNKYLRQLSSNPPQPTWTNNDQLAYWINAYNAYTIQLIIRHYPLKSIKDIGSKIKIPFVNTPWDIKFIRIGQNTYDLNNIEHDILRKNFNEPRIHFAIVCASVSCPKLLNQAYTGAQLGQQLQTQTQEFINDPSRNKITSNQAQLSSIFNWFAGDFTKKGSISDFINQYAKVKIKPATKISFLDYNWNLNE